MRTDERTEPGRPDLSASPRGVKENRLLESSENKPMPESVRITRYIEGASFRCLGEFGGGLRCVS